MAIPPPVHFSWAAVDELSRTVAQSIGSSGYQVEIVVGVARGGLSPAVHISHLLNVRSFRTAIVESTMDNSPYAKRHTTPKILSEVTRECLKGRNVLVIDDAISTGATIQVVIDYLRDLEPAQLRVAVLVQDTAVSEQELSRANRIVDFLGTRVHGWAIFPWTS